MLSIRIHKGTHNEASLRKNALTLHCNLQYYFAFVRALGPRRLEKYEAEEPDMLLHGAMASSKNLLLAKVWRVVFTVYLPTFSASRGGFCSDAPNHVDLALTSLGVVS